jgi:diacylglycerol kinase (ATP)
VLHFDHKPKTGLLLNPLSGRVRKRLKKIRNKISGLPEIILYEASTPEEINRTIDKLIRQNIEILVIVGGDGTVQAILNYIFSSEHASDIPKILIVAGGTTNMTAKDIGVSGGPLKTLNQLGMLLKGQRHGSIVTKPALKVSQDNKPDIYGMFFGAGIIESGGKYFQKHIRTSGITGEIASFIVFMNFALKMLSGRRSDYLNPVDVQIQEPRISPHNLNCLLLFATTLDRLLFGLRPYWGIEDKPLHFTFIRSKSNNFWHSLFTIVLNRGHVLSQSDGYFSCNSQMLSILLNGDLLIDGELFHADSAHGALRLSATTPIQFIVP